MPMSSKSASAGGGFGRIALRSHFGSRIDARRLGKCPLGPEADGPCCTLPVARPSALLGVADKVLTVPIGEVMNIISRRLLHGIRGGNLLGVIVAWRRLARVHV